jgi:hypothetical protein
MLLERLAAGARTRLDGSISWVGLFDFSYKEASDEPVLRHQTAWLGT